MPADENLVSEKEAIEIARDHYKKHGRSSSVLGNPEHEEAWSWERMVVLSIVPIQTVVEREGEHLVYDGDGSLIPQFGLIGNLAGIYDDDKGEQLIAKAVRGDQVAHRVLCYFAAGFVKGGCGLPLRLRQYIAASLHSQAKEPPQRRRGRDPYANNTRDFYIALTVSQIVGLGFRPTRNRATESESACSITAKALAKCGLHMDERNVERIWGQFEQAFRIGAS
jgi:hypothetical protein